MNFNNVERWFIPEGEVSSVTDSNNNILWTNGIDWSFRYFNISKINSIQEDCAIRLFWNAYGTPPNILYTTESDEISGNTTWTSCSWGDTGSGASECFLTLTKDPIVLKGINNSLEHLNITVYEGVGIWNRVEFKVSGALCSLLHGRNNYDVTYDSQHVFDGLFASSYVKYAENLIFPDTTIQYCYANMFSGCSHLVKSPELPAFVLLEHCYDNMFNGCSSLTYIKCLAYDTDGIFQPTTSWVSGLPNNGTFIITPNSNYFLDSNGHFKVSNNTFIPSSNWTVFDTNGTQYFYN